MFEDVAICQVSISTLDERFWTQKVTDGSTTCDDITCDADIVTDFSISIPVDTGESQQDWEVPILDDDKDDPFCTRSTDPLSEY